jgi:hypothetical protein
MTAIIVLTPDEQQLVLAGLFDEPGYRPFPSGQRAKWIEEQERLAEELGDDDVYFEARWTVFKRAGQLQRTVPARHWTRHALDLGVLVARFADGLDIVGFARVEGGTRPPIDGARQIAIGPWQVLDSPLPLPLIESRLPARTRGTLDSIIQSVTRPLPIALARAFDAVLAELVPQIGSIRQQLTRPTPRARSVREALERREANATALSILTRQWRGLTPLPDSDPPPAAGRMDEVLSQPDEDDFITDDVAVFPEWERAGRPTAGWWEFRYRSRRMWIKNINFKHAETKTGADLVYVRTEPDAVVLVQYKRLRRDDRNESYFRDDKRLSKQLKRLLKYKSDETAPSTLVDHRVGPGFSFVKFVDDQHQQGLADDELTRGIYMPADYATAMLAGKTAPPGRLARYYVFRERGIEPSVFVALVRDGWIGSRGDATKALRAALKAPSSPYVTLAVDQPG